MIPVNTSISFLLESQRIFDSLSMLWYTSYYSKTNNYIANMNIFNICIIIISLITLEYVFFLLLNIKIKKLEIFLISLFISRSSSIPSVFEITSEHINKQEEIFSEILSLKKKEFSLWEVTQNIDVFLDLESHIHHEINFIFQICNNNSKLLKDKKFLYIRDIMISKSAEISQNIQIYKRIIHIHNKCISIKNYSIIWLFLPFYRK